MYVEMDRVLQGLRLAKTALGLVPVSVPGLGPAVELALNIVELVQVCRISVLHAYETDIHCRRRRVRRGSVRHSRCVPRDFRSVYTSS